MDTGRQRFTAMVGDPDELRRSALRAATAAAGFHVEFDSANPVDVLDQCGIAHPSLVLTGYAYFGMSGMELAERILATETPPVVVLVLDDMALRERALEAGCFAVAPAGDADALDRVLAEAQHFLTTGERRAGDERRRGGDRRQHQDWSKVTQERRSGDDRRTGDRRTDDAG